jgi:hypothetical protein
MINKKSKENQEEHEALLKGSKVMTFFKISEKIPERMSRI